MSLSELVRGPVASVDVDYLVPRQELDSRLSRLRPCRPGSSLAASGPNDTKSVSPPTLYSDWRKVIPCAPAQLRSSSLHRGPDPDLDAVRRLTFRRDGLLAS